MRAEILSIGTEILLGHITDTNAPYLARHLADLGIDLYFIAQVGDNQARVTATLRRAWERADVIVTTGGLGPTEDDVTREAIAALLGETPAVDPALERDLRAWFAGRDITMPERNVKQAWTIPSATALPNPRGTAPGWYVQRGGQVIVAMPGVPREMEYMWEHEALPRLRALLPPQTLVTRLLRVAGLGESTVEQRLDDLIHLTNPTVATYAKNDAVDVRISAKAATEAEARAALVPVEAEARARLGGAVFGIEGETLAGAVGQTLADRNWTLAVMESCTGGLVASQITDAPGSSQYMVGGLVSYATPTKIAAGVPAEVIAQHGVISPETALAMARAAQTQFGAAVGLGVTGVAGPDPQEGHPVGEVHLAVATPIGARARSLTFGNLNRAEIKRRAAQAALLLLWQTVRAPDAR